MKPWHKWALVSIGAAAIGGVLLMLSQRRTVEALFRRAIPSHGQWMVEAILAASRKYDINPFLLAAFPYWETDFGYAPGYEPRGAPDGTGDAGHGHTPWQIDDRSHKAFLATADLKDIMVTTDYAVGHVIAPLLKRYGSNLDAAIAAYNAGPGNVSKALSSGRAPGAVTTATPHGTYVDAVRAKLATLQSAVGNAKESQV